MRQAEERLGLALPPSAREYVAYAHDLGDSGTATHDPHRRWPEMLFHCAHYQVEHLTYRSAMSLIFYTLDDGVLGVFHDDLGVADPRTYYTIRFKTTGAEDEIDLESGFLCCRRRPPSRPPPAPSRRSSCRAASPPSPASAA